ncbi:MAG: transporter substrate-binding domain-containing protein [Thermoguttaceae bacterium]|nr:transporter substrate-binding domain-containing protein [Thermoguttaceae bacterium]
MRINNNAFSSGSSSSISRRRFLSISLVAPAALALLSSEGCKGRSAEPITCLDDLNSPSMIIGGETETVSLRMGNERLPHAKVANFATPADCFAALQAGKIDAVSYDRPALEYAAAANPAFIVIPDTVGEGHIAVGAPFKNKELMDKVNEFIKQYREDGTYDDMYHRWVQTLNPKMPSIPKPENPINAGKPLKIGNDPQNLPMSFVEGDGSWSGFDTEFVQRLALFLNMDYEFVSLYYDALFPAIESEQLDLAVGNLDKTPERAETMLFSDDYIDCPAGIMVLKSRWQPKELGETSGESDASVPEAAPTESESPAEEPALDAQEPTESDPE